MAFTIKAAKPKKRGKAPKPIRADLCNREHCTSLFFVPNHCANAECIRELQCQAEALKHENLTTSLAFDARCETARKLVVEIKEACNLDAFQRGSTDQSKAALKSAVECMIRKADCKCIACLVAAERQTADMLGKRMAAIENRLADLREYRAANDKEIVTETTDYFKKGNYFTRSGTHRGHGAIALKPKLQMQNSYDVASLTTNSMLSRAIKTAPGENPVVKKTKDVANQQDKIVTAVESFRGMDERFGKMTARDLGEHMYRFMQCVTASKDARAHPGAELEWTSGDRDDEEEDDDNDDDDTDDYSSSNFDDDDDE